MKKTFLIALTLLTNFVFAQTQLSDYYDASSANRREFSYNIVVKIHKTTGATEYDTRYTATLVQASPDSKGFYNAYGDNKYYSCSQLGDVCKPNNLHLISIRVTYTCNGQQKADVITFRNINDVDQMAIAVGAGGKFCEAKDFSMKVMGAVLEPIHLGQIINKINQIGTTKITHNYSNNNNPTTQTVSNTHGQNTTSSSSTSTITGTTTNDAKKHELKLSDIGISNGKSTTETQWQQNYQLGQDLGNTIVDIFSPSPAKLEKRANEEAAHKERLMNEAVAAGKVKDERFRKLYYEPLIEKAERGDENARMILYFASEQTGRKKLVPKREDWLYEAFNKGNEDAYLEIAKKERRLGNEWIGYVQHVAHKGSVDAMIILARFHDLSPHYSKTYSNANLALEWITKAAEKGSPNAMYYLGMIYKYGIIEDLNDDRGNKNNRKSMHVQYNVPKDEKKALEWFEKSIQPDYEPSLYAKTEKEFGQNHINCSYFHGDAYKELSIIYKEGKIVPKDKAKADELMKKRTHYSFKF